MNSVQLVGRLSRDPEVRYSQGAKSTAVARYTLAVQRKFKDADGNYGADFINCVAFGSAAEFAEKFLKKGMRIGVEGRIQTGSYDDKDGKKVYTTDVIVESQEFCESKGEGGATAPAQTNAKASNNKATKKDDSFMNVPDGVDEELPFN